MTLIYRHSNAQTPTRLSEHFIWYAVHTVYPKKYAHGFCFAVLCCGYTLTDFPISIRLTSLALWQSNDCPSASKATLMNMDKYFMWIHYERLHNHNKAKHNITVCIFLGIYCTQVAPIFATYWESIISVIGFHSWLKTWQDSSSGLASTGLVRYMISLQYSSWVQISWNIVFR